MIASNRHNTLPVDRGWAWAVAAGGFLAHVVMGGGGQTNSVLFVEILKEYDVTITTGSLMFMCHTLAFSMTSVLVTTFVMPRLDERRCLIMGGFMNCALSMGASFAPNMGVFIAFISVKGVANGFIFVPAIALIRVYFNKLRSRASIVPWCGGSVAGIIGPFIIRAVRKEFGVRGTYFILSAVELNVCVAGMLLRPLSAYRFRPGDVAVPSNGNTASKSLETDNDLHEIAAPKEKQTSQYEDGGTIDENEEDIKESLLMLQENSDKIDGAADGKSICQTRELAETAKPHGTARRERHNSFFGSVLTLDGEIGTALEVMIEDATDNSPDKGMTRWQKLYRESSLELWSFRWMLLAVLPGTVNHYLISYLPTISNSQGASLDQAALLVTIMASVDLFSRVLSGFIADSNVLPPSKLAVIAQFCMGIACHVFRLSSSFETLIPMTVFIGMFIGSRGPLLSLMCMEVVGTDKMPQAYSIMSMLCTLIGASLNPVLSAVVEALGSFVPAMHIVGSCYILCAVMISLTSLFTRMDVKHGRKQ